MKDSFVFYRSFDDAINGCPIDEQLDIYKAITKYSLDREEPNFTGIKNVVWILIKPQLDANWKRFENGLKGGAPIGSKNNPNGRRGNTQNKPRTNQELTKNKPNVNVNVNDNVNVNTKKIDKESKLSLTDRQKEFKDLLVPFVEQYGKDMIRAFFDYWSEPNKANTKMKCELEKTWSLQGRLRRWERNNNGK